MDLIHLIETNETIYKSVGMIFFYCFQIIILKFLSQFYFNIIFTWRKNLNKNIKMNKKFIVTQILDLKKIIKKALIL